MPIQTSCVGSASTLANADRLPWGKAYVAAAPWLQSLNGVMKRTISMRGSVGCGIWPLGSSRTKTPPMRS